MILSAILWGMLSLSILLILYLYRRIQAQKRYFLSGNVPYLGMNLSRIYKVLSGSISLPQMEVDIYKEAGSAKFVGTSDFFFTQCVYITDLDLMRNVFVKDFDHFVNRRPMVKTQHTNRYLNRMLIMMEDDQWKGVRAKLSPTFTTGKIQRMFAIFRRCSENMSDYLRKETGGGGGGTDLDFVAVFPKYAMDVIASCAFGIDSKCFDVKSGEVSTFEEMGKRFQFSFKPLNFLKFMVLLVIPKIADALKLEGMDNTSQNYFSGIIRTVMKRRREGGERCEDFLQLMMDAQQGLLKADEDTQEVMLGTTEKISGSSLSDKLDDKKVTFDDDDIIANSLLFMLGGFDTTQSLLLFIVYQLALEPEVQQRLWEEVKEKIDKNAGMLTYEGVNEMTYMDLVLNETLRYYPPAARTERSCTKDYQMPDSDFVVKKGTIVGIPIYPVHHDPKYYPNPEKFDPERFLPENKAKRHPYAFMPFGHGPRNCIGMRFALTEVKAVIAQLVYSFRLEPCQKTLIPVKFDRNSNLKPQSMWLRVAPRN